MKQIIFTMGLFFGCGTVALLLDRPGHYVIAGICFASFLAICWIARDRDGVEKETNPDFIRLNGKDIDLSKLPIIYKDEEKIVYGWFEHEITILTNKPGRVYWMIKK